MNFGEQFYEEESGENHDFEIDNENENFLIAYS